MKTDTNKHIISNVKRINDIFNYANSLSVNESSYRFYNEAEDDQANLVEPTLDEPEEPLNNELPDDNQEPMPNDLDIDDIQNDEETIEVDITDLVNDTKDIKLKTVDAVSKVGEINQKLENIFNKVGSLEQNIQKMDKMINQLDALTQQVELMRPPTEEERRKALAKDSYPFSVTIDQYQSGAGTKTQTDLEARESKLSMLNSLMSDYDEMTIKNSFNL